MPIIPRFASVQDPNTPPNVDFSQGIMQSALAGAQLRRMGVEEKQNEAALGMQREGLDMRKQEFGLRKQEFQRGLDTEQDMARAGEFMLNLQSQPRPPQGQPLAPGAAGPQTIDPIQAETAAASEFAKTLKTDAAKLAFTDQFRQYQQGMVIQQNAQRTQARLQDSLIAFGETPEAAPFVPELESLVGQLDTLDGLPPEQQARVLDAVTTKLGGIREAAMSEITRKRAKMEAVETFRALSGQHPATTEIGQAIRQLSVAVELGGMDPDEGVKRAYGYTMNMVDDPDRPGSMVTRRYAEQVRLRKFEETLRATEDAASKGVPIEVIREARQMAETESRSYSDRGEPPPPYGDLFAEAVATVQRLQGGPASGLPKDAMGSLPDKASGSAQGASGPQPEPPVRERPTPQPAPSQSFLSVKEPKVPPTPLEKAAGRVGEAAKGLASDLAGAIAARSEVQILNVLAGQVGSSAKSNAEAAKGPLKRIANALLTVQQPTRMATVVASRVKGASIDALNRIADELESAGK